VLGWGGRQAAYVTAKAADGVGSGGVGSSPPSTVASARTVLLPQIPQRNCREFETRSQLAHSMARLSGMLPYPSNIAILRKARNASPC
jgi:hypothetical protein